MNNNMSPVVPNGNNNSNNFSTARNVQANSGVKRGIDQMRYALS